VVVVSALYLHDGVFMVNPTKMPTKILPNPKNTQKMRITIEMSRRKVSKLPF